MPNSPKSMFISYGWGGGEKKAPHIRRTGVLIVRLKKRSQYLLGCSVSISSARAFAVPFRVLSQKKYMTGDK